MSKTAIPAIDSRELLLRIKGMLSPVYGERLKGVVLYGSRARRDSSEESDVDILVLLDGPINLWEEIKKTVDALYPLQLEVIRPIHAMPVNASAYERGEIALYRNAKREGMAA